MSDQILSELVAAVHRMESRLERVESRLERLESAHVSVRTEVMARLDRFQATLDEVKHDVAASFHANERIERIARNSNEETRALADQVTALQRQVMHLNGRVTTLESRG